MKDINTLLGPEDAGWVTTEAAPLQAFYTIAGLFTHKFGAVDMQLARLHAHIAGYSDFQVFMRDAKGSGTTGTRVIEISKETNDRRSMGPNFGLRFSYFADHVVELRNRIVHDDLVPTEDHIRFLAIDRTDNGIRENVRPRPIEELRLAPNVVVSVTRWLDDFYHDVATACESTWNDGALGGDIECVAVKSAERVAFDREDLGLAGLKPKARGSIWLAAAEGAVR